MTSERNVPRGATVSKGRSTVASDIRLEENVVIIEGNHRLDVFAADIVLDHPPRRKSPHGARRALVHNAADGLTINFNGDYPDGVTIDGSARVNGTVSADTLEYQVFDLIPGGGIVPSFETRMVNVREVIAELEARIAVLEERVTALTT